MVFSKLHASVAVLSAAMGLVDASSHMIMGGLSPIAYERVDSIVNPGAVCPFFISQTKRRTELRVLRNICSILGLFARPRHHGLEQFQPELGLRFPP